MSDELKQHLMSEADRILSTLQLATPADRMSMSNPDDLGKVLLEKGLLSESVEAYKDLADRAPESSHSVYYRLFKYVDDQVTALSRVKAEPRPTDVPTPILISFPVWGAKYIRTMLAVMMPTMMSEKNLPALAQQSEVIVEFSTRAGEAHLIQDSYWYRRIEAMGNVTPTIAKYPDELFEGHPDAPDYVYRMMGVMHHMAVMRARALGGMHVLPLCPDYIMSEDVLTTAMSYLDQGYEMVMMPSVKVRSDQALSKMLMDLNSASGKSEIAINARDMGEFGIRYMHPECKQLVVSIHTKPFSKLPNPMLFPREDGYMMRAFVLQPIVVSADLVCQDIMYDFNTVDGNFLHRVLAGRDPATAVKLMDDSDDGIMLDLADNTTVKESNVVPKFELGHVIAWLFEWRRNGVEEFYKWMFQQRAHLRSGKMRLETDPNDLDEDVTVAVLNHVISKFG